MAEAATVIVVGFDRSHGSDIALTTAASLGRSLQARLVVVHAIDLADYPVDPDAEDWELQAAEVLESERESVADRLEGYPYEWTFTAVRAGAADALNRAADEADATMIVIGHGAPTWHRWLEHLLNPAVSGQLVKRATHPVLVVPPPSA